MLLAPGGFVERSRSLYPGILAALTIAVAAEWLSQHYKAPVMLFALLLGMAFHFLHHHEQCRPGVEFASRSLLRIGVALLGAHITLNQMLSLGPMPILLVVIGIMSTIAVGIVLARWLGLGATFGLLSGGSVGICGASAALAISSVLPATPERERNTILTVIAVTTLSTIAMVTYPMLVAALGLDRTAAGVFLGGTIHDVAQVVGAGYAVSPHTGDVATYVKLLRVSMLIPVVLSVSIVLNWGGPSGKKGRVMPPLFLGGFALLVALNSLGLLSKVIVSAATLISHWCLVTAIAALGVKTALGTLVEVGWRPVALVVVETIWIAGVALVAVLAFK